MYTFYITKDGSIEREHNTLVFIGKDFKSHIPVKNIKEIIILAKVSLSSWALDYIAKLGIIVHMISLNGEYRSSIVPISRNEIGHMNIEQAKVYMSELRNEIAAEIVNGIKYNIMRNLRYYNRDGSLDDIIESIKKLEVKNYDIQKLLGIEGNIWSMYYSSFGKIYKGYDNFQRKYRPPPDPLNALISYGNSVLYSSVLTNIILSGLNPSISFLHEPSERSFSLALDIADIFKPPIVERLVANLINNRIVEKKDFEERDQGVYLTEEGRNKFMKEYRDRMEKVVNYEGKSMSFNNIILRECHKIKDFILDGTKYRAFRMWD